MRNKGRTTLMSLVTALILVFSSFSVAYAATWSSSAQWATWTNGGYTIYNNIWGSGAGYQSIWANSYSNWGVWAQHPNTGGIKSYPNVTKTINKKISAISTLKSSFNVTVPSSGSYSSTYDVWAGTNNAYEIMIWMNKAGAVNPISYNWSSSGTPVAVYSNVSVGGHTWNVYQGSNGANAVYSFVRTSNTNSGTVDILAITNWIKSKGWFSDVVVNSVQFGFEITSSASGSDFMVNSYSVTNS
ncbi:glycosyl hydrolase [Paenibacillus sp. PR3]|uniref:Glycosyl hydrolase n=1 Tax=Paenibacillus terricola TaxID=2763503 RepID=A0ABR8MTM8_9BACL|nr:glycosyl hydrolase [Paenibacillus terricola]MBD3919310.1 glycosyl hydrolase [Paenibacillus terricola]